MTDKMKKVKGPDGKLYKFPKDMSFERIDEIMREQYPEAAEKPSAPVGHKVGAAVGGITDTVTFGFADEIEAGLASIVPIDRMVDISGNTEAKFLDFKGNKERVRARNAKQQQAAPKTYLAGQIGGGLLSGGAGVARMGAVKGGAVAGGAYGVGSTDGGVVDRAKGGALGATSGAAGGFVLQKVAGPLVKLFKRGEMVVDGQLTPQAVKILEAQGYKASDLTPDDMAQITQLAKKGVAPGEAARIVDSESLPVPMKLTQGQRSLDNTDLRTELTARDGALGRSAEYVARDAEDAQKAILRENTAAMRDSIGGNGPKNLTEGGTQLAKRLVADADAAKGAAAIVRDQAKDGVATAPKAVLNNLVGDIKSDLAENGLVEGTEIYDAVSRNFLKRAEAISAAGRRGSTPVQTLMRLRQDVSKASKSGGEGGAELAKIASRIDAAMEDALDQAVIQGDAAAIKRWRKSTDMFREYYKKYDGKAGAKKIIADIAQGRTAADEASAKIFGKKNFGGTAKSAELAREIKALVGEGSEEWQALRQEAFTRILKESPDGNIGPKFPSNLERILREDGPSMREFFNEDEILALRRLARVVRATNARPTGKSNPSQTSLGSAFLRKVGGQELAALAKNLPVLKQAIDAVSDVRNAKKVERLVSPK